MKPGDGFPQSPWYLCKGHGGRKDKERSLLGGGGVAGARSHSGSAQKTYLQVFAYQRRLVYFSRAGIEKHKAILKLKPPHLSRPRSCYEGPTPSPIASAGVAMPVGRVPIAGWGSSHRGLRQAAVQLCWCLRLACWGCSERGQEAPWPRRRRHLSASLPLQLCLGHRGRQACASSSGFEQDPLSPARYKIPGWGKGKVPVGEPLIAISWEQQA